MKKQNAPPAAVRMKRTRKLIPKYDHWWRHTCAECGGQFMARRSDAIYCSGRCRARAWRRRCKDRAALIEMQKTERLFDRPLYADSHPQLPPTAPFPWSRS